MNTASEMSWSQWAVELFFEPGDKTIIGKNGCRCVACADSDAADDDRNAFHETWNELVRQQEENKK